MPWFRHPVSGQVFEAEGVWAELARVNGCIEIPPPAPTRGPEVAEGHDAADDAVSREGSTATHRRRRARE